VYHHGAIARGGPGLRGAGLDVGDEPGAARRHVRFVWRVGEDEDRHAVVVITLPAPSQFEGAPAGDHRACRHELAEHLPARAVGHPIVEPVEQPPAVAAELLTLTVVRSGDEAFEGHRHVETDRWAHAYCTS